MTAAVSEALILAPGEGKSVSIGADRITLKGSTQEDGAGYALLEYTAAAGIPGAPPHVHHSFEETTYILAGEVDFQVGTQTVHGTPGTFILVPRGVPHGFEVVGKVPARWIGIISPARHVQLLEDLGAVMPASGMPNAAKMMAVLAAHDTEMVIPRPTSYRAFVAMMKVVLFRLAGQLGARRRSDPR